MAHKHPIPRSELQSKIGALLHLSSRTRPDITYEVNRLGRSISNPPVTIGLELDRIFGYLKATSTHSLTLDGSKSITDIVTYSDADWVGRKSTNTPNDMRSTSGTITFLGESPICWSSKLQSCVSLSTMESELIALSSGCQDAL